MNHSQDRNFQTPSKGGETQAGVASADSTAVNRIQTGVDLRGTDWKYIRIYDDSASHSGAGGTVARILERGDGFITVDLVGWTSSKLVNGAGGHDLSTYFRSAPLVTRDWRSHTPKAGDKYVLVKDSQLWIDDFGHEIPAIVTAAEILRDSDFKTLNKTVIQKRIDDARAALESALPAGTLEFIKVPALFFGRLNASRTAVLDRSGVAFNPDPVNLQFVNNQVYVPRQFGPRNPAGEDVLEKSIRYALDTMYSVIFVDDWNYYHRREGEVHCGSIVKRRISDFNWWDAL